MLETMASTPSHSGSNPKRILVCDDDPLFRKTLALLLRDFGEVTVSQDSDEARQLLKAKRYDLLLLDVQMRTPQEGLDSLAQFRASDPELAIIMVSGVHDFKVVRQALKSGANDYLVKDFDPEEFILTIERALEQHERTRSHRKIRAEASRFARKFQFIGETAPVREVRKLIEKFRMAPANVLITGETGTGKEIVARLLRKQGKNGDLEPFVAIDSATLHAHTAESVLFGHERGAFTGADQTKRGLFEEADGGVIFFDEIANMPLAIQAKLLRVIQEKEIVRLGSHRSIPLEFRVLAATNRSLETLAERGDFLPDLLQRLNVLPISLPPLRQRKEDLPLLVDHLLQEKAGGRVKLSEVALEALTLYEWPGNVRELSAMLDYSLALIEDSQIDVSDLHPKIRLGLPTSDSTPRNEGESFYGQMAQFEAALLRTAYAKHEGNISQMALRLGMDRSHLHTKLKTHGIHSVRKN